MKASYALLPSENGALEQVISLQSENRLAERRPSLTPQTFHLPAPVKRTVGIAANFLCDNASYLLGIDSRKASPSGPGSVLKPAERCMNRLAEIDSPAARAVVAFFRTWDPDTAREHPALTAHLDDILSGGESGLLHPGRICPHRFPCPSSLGCGLPGRRGWFPGDLPGHRADRADRKHPSVYQKCSGGSGLRSGSGIFPTPQHSAPMARNRTSMHPPAEYAAFAYTSALNALLADRERVFRVGDATVVCWAKSGESCYQECLLPDVLFRIIAMREKELSSG